MDGRKTGFGEEGKEIQLGKHLPERVLHPLPQFAVVLEKLHQGEQARLLHPAPALARPADDLHEAGMALAQRGGIAESLNRLPQICRELRGRVEPGSSRAGRELLV